ncbi:cytochrome P450, partial [Thozetella sp. PMI_491]
FVCRNPNVYKRLQREIDQFYNSNGLQQPITYLQTQQTPYLKAVIAEATRIYPSIIYQLLRYVPDGGLQIDKHFIPTGTPMGMSPITANRDKKVWGDDAEMFRPKRWLESAERTSFLESYNMTYGGHGARACIGRNLALVELHKFVAQMMYNFDMEIVDRERPWKVKTYWFMYQLEFNLRLTPRAH